MCPLIFKIVDTVLLSQRPYPENSPNAICTHDRCFQVRFPDLISEVFLQVHIVYGIFNNHNARAADICLLLDQYTFFYNFIGISIIFLKNVFDKEPKKSNKRK